jgi:acetylornithine deacetylase/succinyl-diaminopimelate desuccinylase-like protein
MDTLLKWVETHRKQLQEDYFAFLRFRSISTDPAFKSEVNACAEWVQKYLAESSFHAELLTTPIHPVVFAERRPSDAQLPTVLIYGHYDVQPVDPIELWESDPFEPTVRDGKVFARGAVDDKGQIFFAMAALRYFHDTGKSLPINVKFCIEGEEEAASVGLSKILSKHKTELRADYLLVVDYDSYDEKTPAINLGSRGILSLEVKLIGSKGDLHSGLYGGIAYNPNRALVEMLSALYDADGRVMVDGFYDDVQEPSAQEKQAYPERLSRQDYTSRFGIEAFGGEKGRSIQEANIFRPVLEINGISGGYAGPGFKTVIPAVATAKISCRLVPSQDPEKISRQIELFLRKRLPQGMKIVVEHHLGAPAFRSNPHSALATAVAAASEEVMGRPCQRVLSGASVPITAPLASAIGAEVVGMGYGLPTDQIHAPNEHFDMVRFERGLLTVVKALERM